MADSWEAYGGLMPVEVGKLPNGKPRIVLMVQVLVCTSEADAKRVTRVHPSLKFKRRRASPQEGKDNE